jgi:1-deoxy-D-xylulose-5-phosphate reductoisomerase
MKRVAILGSTGSIGVSALDVIDGLGEGFEVAGLAARANVELLSRQIDRHRPRAVSVFEPEAGRVLARRFGGKLQMLSSGVEGLVELASMDGVDVVLTAVVGGVGFAPLVAAIKAGKTIALANKEPMVMAGRQLMEEARRWEARIVPVDSEPSAIFQCLQGSKGPIRDRVRRVLLTASGGPFYRRKGRLDGVTVEEALRHPSWKMGRKITVDSSTLMNKGFEAIEIMNLFDLDASQIEIVIHPQSIIHSAVEFVDGSVLAQLSVPDMRFPIQYALTYPERADRRPAAPLDLPALSKLEFGRPDFRRFPCLALALDAAKTGGSMPAVLSAADEAAVEAFLAGRIKFTDIPRVLEGVMAAHEPDDRPSLAALVEIDQWAREKAVETVVGISKRLPKRRLAVPA